MTNTYLRSMFQAFEFCLPTSAATKVPAGAEWLHEIKHDGFRVRVERDGDRVRWSPGEISRSGPIRKY